MFTNMTHENFEAAIRPKVTGTLNLVKCLPQSLDFFVMLASATGILGARGQANYAAGNTFQDIFAKSLVAKGINASSIDLGSVKSVGYVAENRGKVSKQGEMFQRWHEISEEKLHSIIEFHMDSRQGFSANGRYQTITGMVTIDAIESTGLPMPEFMDYPLYTHLHARNVKGGVTGGGANDGAYPIEALLKSAETLQDATAYVTEALQHKLSSMMSISKDDIDVQKPLQDYGVDSLVAVEIRTWIGRTVGAEVSVLDIIQRTSMHDFAIRIASASSLVKLN
jgi:aryl carrier-like protein